jgi:hypothetical protein
MTDAKIWYLRTQDETFGPETKATLIGWAKLGRIMPGQEISDDNDIWRKVEEVDFLDMRFSIDIGDGNPKGPFNRAAAEALLASGRLPKTSTIVEVRGPFEVEEKKEEAHFEEIQESSVVETHEPQVVEKIVEVEKVVEVEKIVEKEVEKIVVDNTRIEELERLLNEERRHTLELQQSLDGALKNASELKQENSLAEAKVAELERVLSETKKDASSIEEKLREQVRVLEDELRRLPQAASEVADIQAAVYTIMQSEVKELAELIEIEKKELEDFRSRAERRQERLVMHRAEILKRVGSNIEEMTRRALIERPEDPRTEQLRRELESERMLNSERLHARESEIEKLNDEL